MCPLAHRLRVKQLSHPTRPKIALIFLVRMAVTGINVMLEHNTGKDIGQHVMALLEDDTSPPTPETPAEISTLEQATNPVSAWARAELAYRAGDARKQQGDPAPRLASVSAGPAEQATPAVVTQQSPDPSHNASLFSVAAQNAPAERLKPAILAFGAQPPNTPEPPAPFARANDAPDATAVLAALGVPKEIWPEQPDSNSERPEKQQALHRLNPQTNPSWPRPINASDALPGQIAPIDSEGKWFSSSMAGALEKYYQANAAKNGKTTAGLDLVN